MKLTIERAKFFNAISNLSKIAKENKIRHSLECILIQAKENKVVLTATDLERTLQIVLEAKVEIEGVALVKGKNLSFLKYEKDALEIELIQNIMRIGNTEISCLEAEEFPQIRLFDVGTTQHIFDIEKANKVIFASANSDNVAINCLRVEKNKLYATDSFKAATITTNTEVEAISIPIETIANLQKFFGKQCFFDIQKNNVMFYNDNTKLMSRTIDIVFPKMEFHFKNAKALQQIHLKLEKTKLSNVCKKIIELSENKEQPNSKFFVQGCNLTISARNEQTRTKEKIETETENTRELTTFLNVKYIDEFLQNAKETIDILIASESSPVLFLSDDFEMLLMPVLVRE